MSNVSLEPLNGKSLIVPFKGKVTFFVLRDIYLRGEKFLIQKTDFNIKKCISRNDSNICELTTEEVFEDLF